jgi:hypothetical protein
MDKDKIIIDVNMLRKNELWYYITLEADGDYVVIYKWDTAKKRKIDLFKIKK